MFQKIIQNVNLIISIDSLHAYESKYYLQVYLDNLAYKIVNKRMIDYLDDNLFLS